MKPEFKAKLGNVEMAIFNNDGRRSVSVQQSYKDNGKWKPPKTLFPEDVTIAIRLLTEAETPFLELNDCYGNVFFELCSNRILLDHGLSKVLTISLIEASFQPCLIGIATDLLKDEWDEGTPYLIECEKLSRKNRETQTHGRNPWTCIFRLWHRSFCSVAQHVRCCQG